MTKLALSHILFAAAALSVPGVAAAQDGGDYRVRVGLGAQIRPEFIGAENSEVAPLWDIDVARGANPFRFEAPDDNLAILLVSTGGLSFGPTVNLERKRKESDVDKGLGRVKTTVEAGAFAQFEPSDSIRIRGDVRKGLGGHEGLVGSIGADKVWRDGDKYVFSVGPRVLFSNAKYQRAYFGIGPAAALASGLPVYDPDGGIHAFAAASGLSYQFSDRFGFFGFGRLERLVGDAGKSPIVRELGSRNQFSAGAGLNYTFAFRR